MAALFGKKDETPDEAAAGGDVAQMEAELERTQGAASAASSRSASRT